MNTDFFPVFVIGVARAGTTLAARILASSSSAGTALIDSQEAAFKAMRVELGKKIGFAISYQDPLWDGYFSEHRRAFFDKLHEVDINSIDISLHMEQVASDVFEASKQFSPMTVFPDFLLKENSVFGVTNKVISRHASKEKPMVVFKDNYIIEFAFSLKRVFPKAKFIFPYRDPRAVVASRIAGAEKNGASPDIHLLSRLRSWRSHLAWSFAFLADFPNDALMIPYEGMVQSPDDWIKRMCAFLNIPVEQQMFGEAGFQSATTNKVWQNNSSFEDAKSGIFTSSLEKWRKVLPPEMVKAIEYLCFHEMRLMGYQTETIDMILGEYEDVCDFLKANTLQTAASAWRYDTHGAKEEFACEQRRHAIIASGIATKEEVRLALLTEAMALQFNIHSS